MKKIILFLLLVTLCFLGSCSKKTDMPYEIIDSAGYNYFFDKKVETIACLWPSGCQLLISMGMGDTLVGVSNETKLQPWAIELYDNLPKVQGVDQYESAESLLKINADIVLTSESNVAVDLRQKGVKAITFSYYSIDEMKSAMKMMSELLDEKYSSKFIDYISYLENNITIVKKALQDKVVSKKTLYYINGNKDNGLYKTAGGNTMNEEWATLAYCDFATSTLLKSNETKVDKEAILNKNPDVVIIGGRYQHKLVSDLMAASEWVDINALKNNCIYTAPLGVSPFDRFGIEIAIMIPFVASNVYSEYFSYDLPTEIINFYSRFAGKKISLEQANYIIQGRMPDGNIEIE